MTRPTELRWVRSRPRPTFNALASTDTLTVGGNTQSQSTADDRRRGQPERRRGHAASGQFQELLAAQRIQRLAWPHGLARLEPGVRPDGGSFQLVHTHAAGSRPLDGRNVAGIPLSTGGLLLTPPVQHGRVRRHSTRTAHSPDSQSDRPAARLMPWGASTAAWRSTRWEPVHESAVASPEYRPPVRPDFADPSRDDHPQLSQPAQRPEREFPPRSCRHGHRLRSG